MNATTSTNATGSAAVGARAERVVGRQGPERDTAGMTNDELRAEIGRLQQELIRRVCGDPIGGVGMRVTSWTTECNCALHKRGESSGGWYCQAHGQQM